MHESETRLGAEFIYPQEKPRVESKVGCRLLALLAPGKGLLHVDLILATSHVETGIGKGGKTSGETPLLILIDAQLSHGLWPGLGRVVQALKDALLICSIISHTCTQSLVLS